MKKTIFAFALCLLTALTFAQESISFGPIIGANFSTMSDVVGDSEYNTGLVVGGQLTHSHVNNWGVGGAILYSKEGVDVNTILGETEYDLTYLRVPVKGFLFFRDYGDTFRPKIFFGPSFAFLLDSDVEVDGEETMQDTEDAYNKFDLGLMAGLGFNARIVEGTWFNFDAGYTHGLLEAVEVGSSKNRTFTVTAGVAFGF